MKPRDLPPDVQASVDEMVARSDASLKALQRATLEYGDQPMPLYRMYALAAELHELADDRTRMMGRGQSVLAKRVEHMADCRLMPA